MTSPKKGSNTLIAGLAVVAVILIVVAAVVAYNPSFANGNGNGNNPTATPTQGPWNPFGNPSATPKTSTSPTLKPGTSPTASPNPWLTSPSPTATNTNFNPWGQPTATPYSPPWTTNAPANGAPTFSQFGTLQVVCTLSFANGATPVTIKSSVANFLTLMDSLAQESVYYNNAKISSLKVDIVATCNAQSVTAWSVQSQQHMELYLKPETTPKVSSTGTLPQNAPMTGTTWASGESKIISTVTIDQSTLDTLMQQWATQDPNYVGPLPPKTGSYYLMILVQTSLTATANGQQRSFAASTSQVGLDFLESTNSWSLSELSALDMMNTDTPNNNSAWLVVGIFIVAIAISLAVVMKYTKKLKF